MQRICTSLATAGYRVMLVGREIKGCPPLREAPYKQTRLRCFSRKGPLFYAEFNIRLLFYLLTRKADCLCAIDLDTIIPCWLVSKIKGSRRVYDAHEFFTEQKEIVSRPLIHKIWLFIERATVPRFEYGYTVNKWIIEALKDRYAANYSLIRNLPLNKPLIARESHERFILYQGAVNEGRCFETLVPAMQWVNCPLVIYGNGNFVKQTESIIKSNLLEYKIKLNKAISPEQLQQITPQAYLGLTLFDDKALNQVHSLANRFFDYIMAGIPQLCVDYPEYRAINELYDVAYLIKDTRPETIATALNKLLEDNVLYERLQLNCLIARRHLNWQQEEKTLLAFYNNLFQ